MTNTFDTVGVVVNSVSIRTKSSDDHFEFPTVQMQVINKSKQDWDGVVMDYFFFGSDGELIHSSVSSDIEGSIAVGESKSIEVCIYESDINPSQLGANPEKSYVIFRVAGYSCKNFPLGDFAVPTSPSEYISFEQHECGDSIYVVGGGLKRVAGEDNEVEVIADVAVQNLSDKNIFRLHLQGELTDKAGKVLDDDFGQVCKLDGRSMECIKGFCTVKDKKLKGAKLKLVLQARVTLTTGFAKHTGLVINEESNSWAFPGQ